MYLFILDLIHAKFATNPTSRKTIYGLSLILLAFMWTTEGAAILGWIFGGLLELICVFLITGFLFRIPEKKEIFDFDPSRREPFVELFKADATRRRPLSPDEMASYTGSPSSQE